MDDHLGDAEAGLAAFERLPSMVSYMDANDLRVLAANEATRRAAPGIVGRALADSMTHVGGPQTVGMAHEVVRTGEPVDTPAWRIDIADAAGETRTFYTDISVIPHLAQDGAVVGVISFGSDVTALVNERDRAQARERTATDALAQVRDVVRRLQGELLPGTLPFSPDLQVAATYVLADQETAASGDWFDAVHTVDGRIGLVVGDVVGHGVSAAVAMSKVRPVLSERLSAGATVSEALVAVDALTIDDTELVGTTLCVCLFDPATGGLTYCTAGHPPPLVARRDGGPVALEPTGALPLGAEGSFPVASTHLDVGDLLVLYSDGLVERPGVPPSLGRVELEMTIEESVVRAREAGLDPVLPYDVADRTMELLTRLSGVADDMTLLVAHRRARPEPLELAFSADPDADGLAVAAAAQWLSQLQVTQAEAVGVLETVGELVANAALHAYRDADDDGELGLTIRCVERGRVEVRVRDGGAWRERSPDSDGRGLSLVRGLAERLDLDLAATGTTAVTRHRLTQPARVLDGADPRRSSEPQPLAWTLDDGVLRVTGAVTAAEGRRLHGALLEASAGLTLPVEVDLSGLDFLGSTGVRSLVMATTSPGAEVTLTARTGSPAQQVLDVVGLPYTRTSPA